MVPQWQNQQHVLFTGKLKMTAKHTSLGRYRPKDPHLDQRLPDWFSNQSQRMIKIILSSIYTNLTVYMITVNTQHMHVNTPYCFIFYRTYN